MAARGLESKQIIFNKIQEIFPKSFFDDKILRIPMTEDGNPLEIKVALTCAKDVIGGGQVMSSTGPAQGDFDWSDDPKPAPALTEPTEKEIQNVRTLMSALNL